MSHVFGLVLTIQQLLQVALQVVGEDLLDRLMQLGLVVLHGRTNDSAGANAKLAAEQVAKLGGPIVSADFVVDRETNSPRLVTCAKDGVI